MYKNNLAHLINVDLIAKFIKTRRLTVGEFCKGCKICRNTYLKVMTKHNCSMGVIFKIATFMDKRVSDLCNPEYKIKQSR